MTTQIRTGEKYTFLAPVVNCVHSQDKNYVHYCGEYYRSGAVVCVSILFSAILISSDLHSSDREPRATPRRTAKKAIAKV